MSRITARRRTGLAALRDRLHDADPTASPSQSRCDCTVGVARLEGEPVGAPVLLRRRNLGKALTPVEPVRGLRSHAAQALDIDVLREVSADGSSVLNLGESDFDGGLSTYKESLGAHPVDHVDLVRERIPVSGAEEALKKAVKRVVGFRE